MNSTVFWTWQRFDTHSNLHKVHPRYPGVTWCGTLCSESFEHGVEKVMVNKPIPTDVPFCPECIGKSARRYPVVIEAFETDETKVYLAAKRLASLEKQKHTKANNKRMEELRKGLLNGSDTTTR